MPTDDNQLRRDSGLAAGIRAVRLPRGSFTGAFANKSGLLEKASGGTLFMDEVGEMSCGCRACCSVSRDGRDPAARQRAVGRRVDASCRGRHQPPSRTSMCPRVRSALDLYYRLNVIHSASRRSGSTPKTSCRCSTISWTCIHGATRRRSRDPFTVRARLPDTLSMAGQRPATEEHRRAAGRVAARPACDSGRAAAEILQASCSDGRPMARPLQRRPDARG